MEVKFIYKSDLTRATYRRKSWKEYDEENKRKCIENLFNKVYGNCNHSIRFDDYLALASSPITLRTIPIEQISANTFMNSRYNDNFLYVNDVGDIYYSHNGSLNQLYSGYSLQDSNLYYNLYTADYNERTG